MTSHQTKNSTPLYPQVLQSNPDSSSSIGTTKASSSNLYPSLDMKDLVDNLFPDNDKEIITTPPVEELLLTIPASILHLIDKQHSVELATGDLSVVRLRQGENVVAVLVRVGQDVQWPLAKDEASVKLDPSHYFFSLHLPPTTLTTNSDDSDDADDDGITQPATAVVNYGLTIASKGQDKLLEEFDGLLDRYTSFSLQKLTEEAKVLDDWVNAQQISPVELSKSLEKKEMLKDTSTAYWTTLAPNVEDYSSCVARGIAAGSGSMIKGILWCGDLTVDRLKWGNEFFRRSIAPCSTQMELRPSTLRRIKRVKRVSKMSENVAKGILSGVVKVSGFFTSPIVNSKVGKKFFSLLPGEIVLASLDGFSRVFDAVEVAGKNVMSTTSTVTTDLVSHRYGENAAGATNEGLDAAGHAIGTAWAVLKIRNALNPKNAVKPVALAKSAAKAAAEAKSNQLKYK